VTIAPKDIEVKTTRQRIVIWVSDLFTIFRDFLFFQKQFFLSNNFAYFCKYCNF
jgi:hypothetical protein